MRKLVIFCVAVTTAANAEPPRYTAQRLSSPDGRFFAPFAMSATGTVIGSLIGSQGTDLVCWDGGWTSTQPWPYVGTNVGGVNRSGVMAAIGFGSPGEVPVVLRVTPTSIQQVTALAPGWSMAGGINDDGTIVVTTEASPGNVVSFTISTSGQINPLVASAPGGQVYAASINNSGDVLASDGIEPTPGIWRNGQLSHRLPLPTGYVAASGQTMNNAGMVIGTAVIDPTASRVPLRWVGGVAELLPSLGGLETWPMSINDAGQILGYALDPSSASPRGVTWIDGQIFDLAQLVGDPAITSLTPLGIDDAGRILATANLSFTDHAVFVLTPVPAPGNVAMLALAGLSIRRRRR